MNTEMTTLSGVLRFNLSSVAEVGRKDAVPKALEISASLAVVPQKVTAVVFSDDLSSLQLGFAASAVRP